MKYYKLIKKKNIEPVEKKIPVINSSEILTKVLYTGICGSDLSVYLGSHPYKKPPVVLGHEFCGKVIKNGKKIKLKKNKNLVTTLPYNYCNKCKYCKLGQTNHCTNKATPSYKNWNGTFADYFVCRKNSIFELDKKIDQLDAVLMEPFAICNHAINLVNKRKVKNVLILGAGNTGLATLMLARINKKFKKIGCVDVFNSRKSIVKKLGADYFIKYNKFLFAKNISKFTKKEGLDLIFITCDYKNVIDDAIRIINPQGTIIITSYFKSDFKINYNEIVKKEILIQGSFLSTKKDFFQIEKLIKKKSIKPRLIISNIYSFDKIKFAFNQMLKHRDKNLKIVLKNEK
jgi:L-iditol 2-dehydrogenase